ncbi:Hypothetical protein I595_2145 [Croceitalea dokdonensis DOKDO 023]|uniref:Uncharacterized protein n=1 Tax=Croceitalea dokdonensis DOKDO 023 TaxID=1300341 RepID=A0A0P7AUX2_9FLAO|nr:hypothetical protein [Croceitalea dokdonensis]KPM31650.1 Hypothetical protein I595_2145 [Croceitalea dokdonensis DOKDO 023]
MNVEPFSEEFSFLFAHHQEPNEQAMVSLSILLNTSDATSKPYAIDYNTLLVSYHLWNGNTIEEFCQKQTISYFLFHPEQDSPVARESFYLDIREFLVGN